MSNPDRSSKRRLRLAVGLAALALVLSAALTGGWLGRPSGAATVAAPPPDLSTLQSLERGFNWIADSIKPAVVFIEVEHKVEEAGSMSRPPQFDMPEWWREFFGPDMPMPRRPTPPPRIPIGQGSGVIFDQAGYVLTNNHVVGNAEKITVHLANGESYPAVVSGTDELTDLAVVKIEADRPLAAAELGDADEAKVGSWVMAIGYPFGGSRYGGRFDEALRYEPTVTVGVISARDRQIESDRRGYPFRDLIQTDAPINPGNSGGPLANIHAKVIGINQAIFTSGPWGGNIGVGFAIPINARTRGIIEKLKGGEVVVRGRLGVGVLPLTEARKQVYGADQGVFVENVEPDSPASEGGLREDDVIVEYNGREIASRDEFVSWVQETRPGTTVEMRVVRDRRPVTLKVTIGALTLGAGSQVQAPPERKKLGVSVEPLSKDESAEIGVSGGVRIRAMEPLGDGARAGLRPGDVILKINRDAVADLESYNAIVDRLKPGDPVVIRYWRGGQSSTAEIDGLSD
jgi:serine protease Do